MPAGGTEEAVAGGGSGPSETTEPTRLPDGRLMAQRDAPVGGQAVLEGVMMRGVRTWAVAVRTPADDQDPEAREIPRGEIDVFTFPLRSWLARHRAYRLPIVRGVVALAESLKIGFKALGISANAQFPEPVDDAGDRGDGAPDEAGAKDGGGDAISGGMWAGTIFVALLFAVGLFFVVPVGLTSLIKDVLDSSFLFWLVEGLVRTAIFFGYLLLLSRMRDLRRVFEYHGAEHKVIAAYEAGDELTPERAKLYSRLHPRCGTSFLLIVMVVAIFVFAPIGLPAWYWLLATRILGIPLIAGISFEIIKWAGRNRRKRWVRGVMYPGLQLQRLTTRDPDAAQLAVSIAALQAVLARETPGETRAEELVGVEVVA